MLSSTSLARLTSLGVTLPRLLASICQPPPGRRANAPSGMGQWQAPPQVPL